MTDIAWARQMADETDAAEQYLQGVTEFEPHDGVESDLNQHAADLMAGPRPELDPTLPQPINTTPTPPEGS